MNNNKQVKTDFNIYNKILDYSQYTRANILNSIPSVHRDIKIHLADETFNLTKLLFYAVYNKGNIRMKYLVEMEVTISTIDMLFGILKNIPKVSNKKIESALKKLEEVKNIIYAWINNEEKRK